jgi:hypothetical protein
VNPWNSSVRWLYLTRCIRPLLWREYDENSDSIVSSVLSFKLVVNSATMDQTHPQENFGLTTSIFNSYFQNRNICVVHYLQIMILWVSTSCSLMDVSHTNVSGENSASIFRCLKSYLQFRKWRQRVPPKFCYILLKDCAQYRRLIFSTNCRVNMTSYNSLLKWISLSRNKADLNSPNCFRRSVQH